MVMETQSARPIDPVDAQIGQRVRSIRRQRDLSLQQVAREADLSVGFLSQIERGLSSPTLRDLMRIASAMDAGLNLFFDPDEAEPATDDPVVVRVAHRRDVAFHEGVTKQLLTPPGEASLAMYLVTMEPHGRTGEALYTHQGEEAGLVLQGRMLLTVERSDYLLNEGDSFRFLSARPHRFANPTPAVTRVVWVNVNPPPSAASSLQNSSPKRTSKQEIGK
jgi:transcriptional regulator with XRE-family HTH domain